MNGVKGVSSKTGQIRSKDFFSCFFNHEISSLGQTKCENTERCKLRVELTDGMVYPTVDSRQSTVDSRQ